MMASNISAVVPSGKRRGAAASVKGRVHHVGVAQSAAQNTSLMFSASSAKRAQRRTQFSVNTDIASYDKKDPFQAINVLLKLVGSLASRLGGCQYKLTPEEHKLSLHLLGIVEPFIGSSAPARRTIITRQPTEILDAIVFHVESREDLRHLALSCHRMHSIVAPRHIEYRIIRAKVSSISLWNHLIVNRSLAKNIRRLEVIDERSSEREVIPSGIIISDTDLESTDDELGAGGIHSKQEKFFLAALTRMTYLAQFVWNSNHSPISLDEIWPTLMNRQSLRDVEINDNLVFCPSKDTNSESESESEGEEANPKSPVEKHRKVLPALKSVALRSTRHTYGSTKHPDIAKAKGLLNSCPNLEALEITYNSVRSQQSVGPVADDLLLVGRWPQLRSLSLTNLRCNSLTGSFDLFILAHLNLEVLHIDILPRNRVVFPPNSLPKLKEVKACKEIVGAILECPLYDSSTPRPIEIIKGVCLSRAATHSNPNIEFIEQLKRFAGETLKRIELVSWNEMEDVKRLVESTPKLSWLDLGKRPASTVTTTNAHSHVVDWATLLSGLPDLTTFHGVKFFYEVSTSALASMSMADRSRIRKNDESASMLAWKCSKLRRVDHWADEGVVGGAKKVVVLIKDGRDVKWEVRRVKV